MKTFKYILFTFLVSILSINAQAPSPGEPQESTIVIKNITIHKGDGELIQNGSVVFENGLIISVATGDASEIYEEAQVIDGKGQHLYPGFILPDNNVGLVEVNAVKATIDSSEPTSISPNIRSIIAYNTDSEIIPTLRFNGILLTQVVPSGGLISGQSSIVQLDAWNWEDAVVKMDEGIYMSWPMAMLPPRWWMNETKWRENEDYDKNVVRIRSMFGDAQAYAAGTSDERNLKLDAMKGLFDGSKKIYVHANRAKEIVSAITFVKEKGIENIVLVGGADAMYVSDFLKENNIPVILTDVHRLPMRPGADVFEPYKLASKLVNKGLKVALSYGGVANSRNLGFYAGTASAYGLGKEEALKLITSNTAEILGLDKYGVIQVGKSATFFLSEGDALDMSGNKITHAFIDGRKVKLDAMQQELYQKYKEKYNLN
ncbi:amidohydrolase family protein [Marinigracilibium pacificum]|uniref:Amidohydrolase family protein n=1 Tax=Marinigracilibium pacificum TaxID=2729599 RepID=A0A848J7U7_9BACT|nr:amidohydrolase family protein [Marinigracilibium pacificum]NMM50459.1 amidohydrolase family protein [Marinigracilibium pacificum]